MNKFLCVLMFLGGSAAVIAGYHILGNIYICMGWVIFLHVRLDKMEKKN